MDNNVKIAERMGLLDRHKIEDGAPLYYTLVYHADAIDAIKELHLPFVARSVVPQGPVFLGWTEPCIAAAIELYYSNKGYSDLSILEFLRKICK